MKYTFQIELDENRTNCISCPLCNSDDYYVLQDEDDLFLNDSWDYQLSNCPLKEVDPQTQEDLINWNREQKRGSESTTSKAMTPTQIEKIGFCPSCGCQIRESRDNPNCLVCHLEINWNREQM